MARFWKKQFGIPRRYLKTIPSPWAVKRLHEFGGDINQFRVVKRYPASVLRQIAVARPSRATKNNQDISSLVGKVDIRKLENSQDDPDAYSYSGGLCLANQGLLEFVECSRRRSRCCIRC